MEEIRMPGGGDSSKWKTGAVSTRLNPDAVTGDS
jgi:hypothetical protein